VELFHFQLRRVHALHADPHPGNVLLTDDHRIALLDLGMVGHITPQLQENLLQLLLAALLLNKPPAKVPARPSNSPNMRLNELL
jgi:predicted unusual protein kinase regulating ubiquinone biosynthesis (AarF/ABC1/UbiB family)